EKDALVKEAKKLAEQLQAYLDAPASLATAQDMKAKAEAKLDTVKAELTTAQSTLENLLSAYRTEHAKLVDLQTEYEALVDLAEKAQENVVAKLPDGTVIAVPNVAPTAEALPEVNIEELQKALATGKEVTLDAQGKVVVKEKRETYSAPAVKSVENEKMSYSRVEKAKTLPNTGTKESNLTLFVLAILSGLGIAVKRREGK
ncbi:LPXTG cell wall anchor domain-containing protein, partial [Streptococcus oralis]|uniref:LPXTG cell wall anchor domain-containing protein n=1 Tax=Streptococcus oralis TaxID=1303 RepID=UPI000AC4E9AE